MNPIILVVADAHVTKRQIQAAAAQLNVECYMVSYGDHLTELVKKMNPCLLIVTFDSEESDWVVKYLGEIKAARPSFPIVGVVHEDLESEEVRLQKAGCERIVKQEKFPEELPRLLELYVR